MGGAVVDADALAAAALRQGDVKAEIAATFGTDVLDGSGAIDRAVLAARVFDDAQARERLEAIVHPRVARSREVEDRRLAQADPPPPMIVHDVPLLFETGMDRQMDAVVVVDAPRPLRLHRLAARSGWGEAEIARREAAQWSGARKRAGADLVIDNDASEAILRERVREVWVRLTTRRR
ncbi:MAG: dephospho-CoA kinase [Trueperaceae bacterium]